MSQFGRTQLFPNVVASGLAYLAAVVIGFVMPRVIYESIGPVALGLWDLGWSFLVYISFSGIGLGSAIAHYLAAQESLSDEPAMLKTCVTGFIGQLVFAVLLGALFIVGFFAISVSSYIDGFTHNDVLLPIGVYLGITVTIVIIGDVAQGILLGCHKSRIGEIINMLHDIALAASMIVILLAGHGIVGLALVTMLMRLVAECVRYVYAFRVFENLRFHPKEFSRTTLATLIFYGLKSSAAAFQELIVYQSARLVLFFSMGPIALAAFSRYATIARQINRLVDRLGISVATITSGYIAEGQEQKIKDLYYNSVQGGMLLTLPILSIFCVFGDVIVKFWMGDEFVISNVAWIFAGACLLHANFSLSNKILSGINAHGRITLFCLMFSGVALSALCLITFPQTQAQAAVIILVVIVLTVHVPHIVFARYRLSVSMRELIAHAYAKPVLLNVAFIAILYWAHTQSSMALAYAIVLSGVTGLVIAYWKFAIDQRSKQALAQFAFGDPMP